MRGLLASILVACAGLAAGQGLAGPACLPIRTIEVSGVVAFDAAERAGWVQDYQGKCLGLSDFDALIRRITGAYVDRGLILARAYLPEQDLAGGRLQIAVVEGSLDAITVNGQAQPRWMAMVFPGQIGQPVHIRRVEQGLDQIKTMPRWQASMEFEPSATPGGSTLAVTARTQKPWELRFTSNNRGNDPSGLWISGVSGDFTNLAGLNDTLSFGVTRSLSPSPFAFAYGGDDNRSANLSWKLPYGRHLFTLSGNYADYTLTIPGAISPIPTSGQTRVLALQGKSLLARDQRSKTHLTLDLTRTDTSNYIMDVLIGSSSRVVSSVKATLSHERAHWGGDLSLSLWAEAGVRWFGAEASDQAQFRLWGLSANFQRDFQTGIGKIGWTSTLNLQSNAGPSYPAQRYSLGGASTVRGTRVALAMGERGGTWRNEIALTPAGLDFGPLGKPVFYAGLDIGFADPGQGAAFSRASGGALGLRLQGERGEFDLSWQEVLSVSAGLQRPKGEVMMSFSLKY